MATKSDRASTAKSHMSDSRRERLLDIQKREQLKGLLVNKFKVKYGDRPQLAKYIDNEVQRFLKNDRLTEDNLKRLDDKILKEAELRVKKEDVLSDHKSVKSGGFGRGGSVRAPSVRGGQDNMDTRSVASSRMSGASRVSKQSHRVPKAGSQRGYDDMSLTSQ